jgi:hypothetical protein
MSKRDWAVALLLAVSALTIAACGSGGGGGGDSTESAAEQEEAQLEFTECMRGHGVEMEDPKPGQRGVIMGISKDGEKSTGVNPEDPATKKALAACQSKLGELGQPPSPEEQEEFKEDALAFAQCMREHGIEMPDPRFDSEGHVQMKIGGPGGGPNPESPAFQEAQEGCQESLPNGKGPMFGAPPK